MDVQSPRNRLSDLLQEVRCCSNEFDRKARAATRPGSNERLYRQALHALLDRQLQSMITREQVVGYASAAELGLRMDPPIELVRRVSADNSFAIRVLFWAVQRRMRAARIVTDMRDAS